MPVFDMEKNEMYFCIKNRQVYFILHYLCSLKL